MRYTEDMPYSLLTPGQRAKPHRSVADNRYGRVSVLERAFAQHRHAEIMEWDRLGVVEDAMAGRAASRRVYSSLLITRLLTPASTSPLDRDNSVKWNTLLERLWSLGGQKHEELFGSWLVGAARYPFADTLLDAGANPHGPARLNGLPAQPLSTLFECFRAQQQAEAEPRFYYLTPQEGQLRALEARIDRCLAHPGAEPKQLNLYLGRVVASGLDSPVADQAPWRRWRDQLLTAGAKPTFGLDGALTAFTTSGPAHHRFTDYDASRAVEHEISRRGHAFTNDGERQSFLDELIATRHSHWFRMAQDWMAVLLPAIDLTHPNMSDRNQQAHTWGDLLDQPEGAYFGRQLLAYGVRAPWNAGQSITRSQVGEGLFTGDQVRDLTQLRAFLKMTAGLPLDLEWRQAAAADYLTRPLRRSGKHQTIERPITPNRSALPLSVVELDALLALERWDPAHPVNKKMVAWLSRLPATWRDAEGHEQVPLADRKAMMAALHNRGVIAAALRTAIPGNPTGLLGPAELATYREWIQNWTKYPEDYELLFDSAVRPRLCALAALEYVGSDEPGQRRLWIGRALEHDPGVAPLIWDTAIARFIPTQSNSRATARQALSTLVDLRASGWAGPEAASRDELFERAMRAVDRQWPATDQVALVDRLVAAGFDIAAHGERLLSTLLKREAELSASALAGPGSWEPLLSALFAAGADPTQLPAVQYADRPLTHLFQAEQVRVDLERRTAQAPDASLPSRGARRL